MSSAHHLKSPGAWAFGVSFAVSRRGGRRVDPQGLWATSFVGTPLHPPRVVGPLEGHDTSLGLGVLRSAFGVGRWALGDRLASPHGSCCSSR
jgi:hypothetical protein